MSARTVLPPGFIAFHSNRAEDLAQVVVSWIRRHPLNPLEEEIILVQSNGMAEWVKMELARMGGVCAATRVELPSRFLWRSYRQVLGPDAVPRDSALDKLPMVWRLMQLLPGLLEAPAFAPVAGFLKANEPDRLMQLASQLADLFDQYQNYRADWLDAWAQGQDHLLLATGAATELPPEQRWQPPLWRALLETLNDQQQQTIRPSLHQRVLAHLEAGAPPHKPVARRVVVFGMSQIPWTTLQALAALSAHSQIMLAIPNPCRFYWGDIMAGRELLHSLRRRQPWRNSRDLSAVSLEDMHQHAHPLLASWGRQGRDFIRQLDVFDDAEQSRLRFGESRIDLFDDTPETAQTPWLRQVQNRIRDLTPLVEHSRQALAADDRSIVFHSAHSRVRELEILHDQLLHLLAHAAQDAPLSPRDIVVMVPDIAPMAPAIQAVFGQYKRQDARFIPFDIADLGAQASSPLLAAMDWLLRLPQQRCTLSELTGLLEVSAIASRFGIDQASLPKLTRWMAGAGIRWGLNAPHRADLGLMACGEQNSAWFGLHRMLMGFASGAVEAPLPGLAAIEPYAEVGGLEAELAGSLAHLLQALLHWWAQASSVATPEAWVARFRGLLAAMVKADSEPDRQALSALEDALLAWQHACGQADFSAELPLQVARSAWLQALDQPSLNQRFRAGGVTFCTLMPMRAVPFEVVCLLGMNDGDYPRRSMRSDFDLMGLPGTARPGDRSRRDDDRQLMLEALLSARRLLYVSWCGHSVRDNSAQPPSVLVSQLRDYLAAGWSQEAVDSRSTAHPLQPFSRRYFETHSPLISYAREWCAAHADAASEPDRADLASPLPPFVPNPQLPLTLNQLTRFLRHPVKAFFRQRLLVVFEEREQETPDEECFAVDGLHEYSLIDKLLAIATAENSPVDARREPTVIASATKPAMPPELAAVHHALVRLRNAGELPLKGLGDLQQQALEQTLRTMLRAWHAAQARFPQPAERQSIRLAHDGVVLEDWIDPLRLADRMHEPNAAQPLAWLTLEAGKLLNSGKKPAARPDKLLKPWIRSLAIAAAGVRAEGVVVGRDGVLEISPMAQDEAISTLQRLLDVWQQGMTAPLPLPPKTALAWLANPDKPATLPYEGGFQQPGEIEEPCMARIFPDYDTLRADGRFETLAQWVYQPLLAWAAQHVRASHHSDDQPLTEAEAPA